MPGITSDWDRFKLCYSHHISKKNSLRMNYLLLEKSITSFLSPDDQHRRLFYFFRKTEIFSFHFKFAEIGSEFSISFGYEYEWWIKLNTKIIQFFMQFELKIKYVRRNWWKEKFFFPLKFIVWFSSF